MQALTVPRPRRFSSSLAISAALHAVILLWLWIHRPQIIEVSLPGTLSVDLVGAFETPSPAPASTSKAVEAPPQPIKREEVVTPTRRVKTRPVPKPPPAPPRRVQPQQPAPPTTAPATPSTGAEARIGLSGAPGVASDSKLTYYLISVRNRIGENWVQPSVERRTRSTIFFRIARDGSVTDARIEVPSGDSQFDQLALRAVRASSPFGPLPAFLTSDDLGVHFDFQVSP